MIATDAKGNVVMIGDSLPAEFNGVPLTLHELTPEQKKAYSELPDDRSGATFDGKDFLVIPSPPRPDPVATLDDVIAVLTADQKQALDAIVKGKKK